MAEGIKYLADTGALENTVIILSGFTHANQF